MPYEAARGKILRYFTARTADNKPVDLAGYRRRKNLVIFFHHGQYCAACQDRLDEIIEHVAQLEQHNAMLIAIGSDIPQPNPVPDSVLILGDTEMHGAQLQHLQVPTVLVTDRYGEIYAVWHNMAHEELPHSADIIAWLRFIETLCDECTHTEWDIS